MLLHATLLHYAVLGLPWVPYPSFVMNNYFWHAASNEIEKIEADLRHSTGREPIVVGMNKFSAASALAFYDHDGGAMEVRSRNMFGGSAVMYELWHPSQLPTPSQLSWWVPNSRNWSMTRKENLLSGGFINLARYVPA
ncbi:MAG TPA: hypothetical protein VHB01_04015 [Nitrosospira sp.]|nr:hypothetical protein [Nitrosospira sp.]